MLVDSPPAPQCARPLGSLTRSGMGAGFATEVHHIQGDGTDAGVVRCPIVCSPMLVVRDAPPVLPACT